MRVAIRSANFRHERKRYAAKRRFLSHVFSFISLCEEKFLAPLARGGEIDFQKPRFWSHLATTTVSYASAHACHCSAHNLPDRGGPCKFQRGGEHFFCNQKNGGPGGGSPLVGVWGRSPQKNLKIAFLEPSEKFDF